MLATSVFLLTIGFAFASPPSTKYFNMEPAQPAMNLDAPADAPYKLSYADYKDTWESFKVEHNKQYKDEEEEAKRFAIFMETVNFIEYSNWKYHNQRSTFFLDVNQFSDLTNEEFRANNKLWTSRPMPKTDCKNYDPKTKTVSDKVDWRQKGYVTSVKDQGDCGSCWAFSAIGSIEGQWFASKGKLDNLSEQQLLDCSVKYGDMGCNGGLPDFAFDYLIASAGVETEANYPYIHDIQMCRFNKSEVAASITGCLDVVPHQDEDALKVAVGNIGPISIGIDGGTETFQSYKGGILNDVTCSPTTIDHGVLAVGYGSENGDDFWIVKNSWGEKWGEKGYVRMSRNKNNQCGIATLASFPVV